MVMWQAGYRTVLWLVFPWLWFRLWWRGRAEPGYRKSLAERFGFYKAAPHAPVIWLHAVSVGETRAAEPLVRALKQRYPGYELLVTHMTATGRETAQELFGSDVLVSYLPYDYPAIVRRFLRHFRPRLGILMETEIWFNLIGECKAAGVPVMLANARMSEKSARGYEVVRPLVRPALRRLTAIGAQTRDDAARLEALGATGVEVTGNLKFDIVPPEGTEAKAAQFRAWYGERAVFLAASTREGEEELLLDALDMDPIGRALLVIVPRHPQRFDEVARLLDARAIKFARRSADAPVAPDCAVLLGDSMGEMAAYYGASDAAFIGGSLLAYGGQNLIEACALGTPVLIGPHTFNFAQAAEAAVAAGAAIRVNNATELLRDACALLDDADRRRRMGSAGQAFCAAHRGATQRTLLMCERLLDAAELSVR
jgi:3-deoxy-D-manno-octulosonic-acid transferase